MSDQTSFSTEISTGSELVMNEIVESIRKIITDGKPVSRDACEDLFFDGNPGLAGSPAVDLEPSQFWENSFPQPAEAFHRDDKVTNEVSGPLKCPQLAIEADDLNLVKSLMRDLLDAPDEQDAQIDLDDALSIPDVDETAISATETVTGTPRSVLIQEASGPLKTAKTDVVIDELTEMDTAGTFAKLSQAVENKAAFNERGPRVGDLVQDALRPMLKTWLDDNLKAIVERAVAKEIKRISSGK